MGRKKRSGATANDGQSSLSSFPPPPPLLPPMTMGMPPPPPMMTMAYNNNSASGAAMAFDQYGRPAMPPPPPAMMMTNAPPPPPPPMASSASGAPPAPKRSRPSDDVDPDVDDDVVAGERKSYPVKRYRPDSYYRSIEAFARYTKSHRMLDAAYVRWTSAGSTPDRPHVFGIRIAGSYLSWGRGKTRDAAIDAAVRAAFHLVAAHGYDDFAMTEDCFTEEPYDAPALAPMPPPPPPPPPHGGYVGHMGMGMGVMIPPLPPGGPPPGMPPNFSHHQPPIPGGGPPGSSLFGANPPPAFDESLIPQPAAPCANLAIASAVSTAAAAIEGGGVGGGGTATVGVSVSTIAAATATAATTTATSKGLVYSGMSIDEGGDEMSMEETRMRMPRYWTSVLRGH
ncbi:hypothetical protein ACHAW5_004939 [Stephanodiscus triporus]|uniref:DRBM domain-containing protein n=1 Tax=Stephanodiscus triporus TaxID=2934178 RepID=A0ABD3NCS2_9STRA